MKPWIVSPSVWLLLCFTFPTTPSARTDFDDDRAAVVVDAGTRDSSISRNSRQFFYPPIFISSPSIFPSNFFPFVNPGPPTCSTQDGSQGICKPFKECYPVLTLNGDSQTGYLVRNIQLQNDVLENTIPCFPPLTIHAHHNYGQGGFSPFRGSAVNQFDTRNGGQGRERSTDEIICCVPKKSKPPPAAPVPSGPSKQQGNKNNTNSTDGKIWPPVPSSCSRPNVVVQAPGVEASAPVNAYPWMAAFLNKARRQFCGGALIDTVHILTAAHCFDEYIKPWQVHELTVVLGAHNILEPNEKGRVEIKVEKIIKHAHFNERTFEHDIALIRLAESVNFTSTIQPLCLKRSKVEELVDAETRLKSDSATLAGWGRIQEGDPKTSPTLRHAAIKLWTNEECQRAYDKHSLQELVPKIKPTMICAGSPGLDACGGDSGGPLFLTKSPDSGYGQIGIVSWGAGCGRFPGVYTRVSPYIAWIRKNTARL